MSDRDDSRRPDYDKTTPNIRLPNPQPPERQPSAPRASNRYDLTAVNFRLPADLDEEDEFTDNRGLAPPGAPAPYAIPDTAHYQQPPPQVAPKSGIPIWAWAAGGGVLALLLLIGGALYLFWPSGPTFTLKVLNAPHGSKVFVDDVPMGVSQQEGAILTQGLRADEPREVRVTQEGYVDWRTTVEGVGGEIKVLRVKMTPLPKSESAIPTAGDEIEQDLEELGRARVYGINFDPNSDRIRDDSKQALGKINSILRKRPDWKLVIEGHTDSTSTQQYNQELSERRAAAVKSFLQAGGIDASRLETAGYGASKPVAGNDTAVGRALNRRVEFLRR